MRFLDYFESQAVDHITAEVLSYYLEHAKELNKQALLGYLSNFIEGKMMMGQIDPAFFRDYINTEIWGEALEDISSRLDDPSKAFDIISGIIVKTKDENMKMPGNQVIGLGYEGLEILGELYGIWDQPESNLLAIAYEDDFYDRQREDSLQRDIQKFKSVELERIITPGLGDPGIMWHRAYALSYLRAFEEGLNSSGKITLIIPLESTLGPAIFPILAGICQVMGAKLIVYALMPWGFESIYWWRRAENAWAKVGRFLCDLRIIYPDLFFAKQPDWEKRTFGDVLKEFNKLMAKQIVEESIG